MFDTIPSRETLILDEAYFRAMAREAAEVSNLDGQAQYDRCAADLSAHIEALPVSLSVPRPDLRAAGWERRLAFAKSRGWSAEKLATACGFTTKGTAVMAARCGVQLPGMVRGTV
ncbi:hypothetical protein [Paracoccus sp. (in: a-proteobacteria)]|uniref:hypothetical protein n=1 Tax=Paracoccus sp. TaxID=267 RepID=UPI00289798A5|nr:hypothetical protein [Paracoccus sp. (in: a-proteobacteria)]